MCGRNATFCHTYAKLSGQTAEYFLKASVRNSTSRVSEIRRLALKVPVSWLKERNNPKINFVSNERAFRRVTLNFYKAEGFPKMGLIIKVTRLLLMLFHLRQPLLGVPCSFINFPQH